MSAFFNNPFGIPTDPKRLSSNTTPLFRINSTLYENLDTIFSYKSFDEQDLLDAAIKRWAARDQNHLYFQELQLRPGAGKLPLGYLSEKQQTKLPVGIITPGFGFKYFYNTLKGSNAKLAFTIAALDYVDDSIVSDYVTPLKIAQELNYPVITPINHNEVQHTTALSLFLSQFTSTIHLFDGASYAKTVLNSNEDSVTTLPNLHIPEHSSFDDILTIYNENSPIKLHNFQYFGVENPETVFVTYGSVESELFSKAIDGTQSKVGHIAIRIPLPFDTDKFVACLPSTTKNVIVISQSLDSNSSPLKETVAASLFFHGRRGISVTEYIYKPNFVWSLLAIQDVIGSFVTEFQINYSDKFDAFTIWANDNNDDSLDLGSNLVHSLAFDDDKQVTLRTRFDNINNAGTFQAQIISLPDSNSAPLVTNIDSSKVSFVANVELLRTFDIAKVTDVNGTIILVLDKDSFKDQKLDDVSTYKDFLKLPIEFLKHIASKNIKLVLVDKELIGDREQTKGRTLSFVSQSVFWKYAYNLDVQNSARRIWGSSGADIELLAAVLVETITNAFEVGIKEVPTDIYKSFSELEDPEEPALLQVLVNENAFHPNSKQVPEEREPNVFKVSDIAKKLTFKEAYGIKKELRPDLPVKNFVVKVKKNKRVTPEYYSRNIFEIEFDISGTGLKYDIGEALGIHAKNNETLVRDFLQYYGLNENAIVSVPSKEDVNAIELRTVLQTFSENLDIFGKPPKRFYESLIDFAQDNKEKAALQNLVSSSGAAELKRYQEEEFYTYADIFRVFPSCRPSLADLVNIVAPLKRREYSIASSQKVHPNEVHLLIVVVDWIDKQGRKRYGQASKYLSDLPVGAELVVSVKPSVMKLPPSTEQPVIMSGLGTGLAPFKAIVEEKLWQKQQGHTIGQVYLYLGARHKREEYLYGELWEAYKDAGIITHIGAAFSRDQPQKIYIQDRIKENLKELKVAMMDNKGSFYLCGPTWPVPDITKALQDIIEADAKEKGITVDLNQAIEDLKESSRYILEVY
ncbi:probable Sulfite reductase [NADPH] flavoprotein component [Saccharomycodes ludwigii]|uniref:assimilatory sulfite reductase (NADPH) n=2 Tax=Saccharomycodes ludwigii TaxID=36035 RepID=A0A376B2F8_9ASCO|nr:probable Sulfite reductase [NADPH] flavoprotein component [Saccharomycodes ludwigii]